MKVLHYSEVELSRIYDNLLRRIQHIGIAIRAPKTKVVLPSAYYDLTRTDTPSIGEVEDAFKKWNCAILTAFRKRKDLSPEENYKLNKKRNAELKLKMLEQNLKFRSVKGCYREANWEKADEEICFFATNTEDELIKLSQEDRTKSFFNKIYRLAEYYEQDCFLFTFPGDNRVAFLVATNDDGRNYFRDDIKFAGPLFTHVPDIGDWTDCSDGRISFRLKGMIQKGGTGNKKIKIGEGDLFDIDGYSPDGLLVIRGKEQMDLKEACHNYQGDIPLVERYFDKEELTAEDIHLKVTRGLNVLTKQKCKRIGFHCSASLNGSYVLGAVVAFNTIKMWAERNSKKLDWIVIVDIYGDYSKVLNNLKQ